jgi:polyphenol oxidase
MRGAPPPLPVLRGNALDSVGFRHGFSTRAGGVSEPPFDTCDFALLRDPDALRENQARLAAAVGFDADRLFQARQVHGARVLEPAGHARDEVEAEEADALSARAGSGDAVAVRVADCVPVLVACDRTGSVAAIHAGWRGVVAGVVGAALDAIGSERGSFAAAIGPCIGACCFEVGLDVAEQIERVTDVAARGRVIRERRGDKAWVDLRVAVRSQLVAAGVAHARIDDVPGSGGPEACTRCNAEAFYSYRRDGDDSGRLIAVICPR